MKGLFLASLALLTAACSGAVAGGPPSDPRAVIDAIPKADLQRLARRRIYFGHQSIGYNIVDGLAAIAKDRPDLGLQLRETRRASDLDGPLFAHERVGRNDDPVGKIRDFAATLDAGVGAKADVAFFKFCYVDVQGDTDVERLFAEYRAAHAALRARYPATTLVHVTIPLATIQTGPKAFVKKIIGKKRWGADANVARHRFNELLRREYAGKEPVYDLAAVEAVGRDGSLATFEEGGRDYPMLAPEWGSDGKHLNDPGARWAAANLLATLAAIR